MHKNQQNSNQASSQKFRQIIFQGSESEHISLFVDRTLPIKILQSSILASTPRGHPQ